MNWTVAIIAALITLSLASGVLPAQVSGLSTAAYLIGGVIGSVGLLLSILAHELGHAFVGRANGLKVDEITLWIFGGVAQLEGEIEDPRVEAKVAGVGPAISIVIGIAGLGAAALIGTDNLTGVLVGWLGIVNLVLGVFNLLPGTPLDGGRLLHAFLWKRSGNKHRATVSASRAGKVIGYGLMGIGAFEFLSGRTTSGLWTAAIGWVLVGAAGAEVQQSRVRSDLAGIRIGDLAEPAELLPDWLVVEQFAEMYVADSARKVFLLVGFDGRPSGYVTIGRLGDIPADERLTRPVREYALSLENIPRVGADSYMRDVLAALPMPAGSLVALVTEDGQVTGVLTRERLTDAVQRARALRPSE
jgi:Zn-dependent protease